MSERVGELIAQLDLSTPSRRLAFLVAMTKAAHAKREFDRSFAAIQATCDAGPDAMRDLQALAMSNRLHEVSGALVHDPQAEERRASGGEGGT